MGGPWLEPALKVARAVGPLWLGLEYYATLGPLAAPLPLRQQDHEVYEAVDVLSIDSLELNAGVGEGLTPVSAGLTFKAIVGYTFDFVANRSKQKPSQPPGDSIGAWPARSP
jgi:hypothetical protein